MARSGKKISVELGPQYASLERHLKSGQYKDADDVLRAALRALAREESALDEVIRTKVKASLTDKRPNVPATDVFKRLRARHNRKTKAA